MWEDGAVVQIACNDEGCVGMVGGEIAGHVDAEAQGVSGGSKEEVGTQDEKKDDEIGDGDVFFHGVSAFLGMALSLLSGDDAADGRSLDVMAMVWYH